MAPPPRGRFRRWMRRVLIGLVATTLGLLVVAAPAPGAMVAGVDGAVGTADATVTRPHVARRLVQPDHALRADPGVAARRAWRLGAAGLRRTGRGEVSLRSLPREARRPRCHAGQMAPSRLRARRGSGPRFPRRGRAARQGSPPRSLPAFAALRLHDIAVVYDDRDARFRTETKGLRVDLLPTGTAPGDLAGDLVAGATTVVRWEPRGTTLTLRGGPRVFLAWRRRRRSSCNWMRPRGASSRTCALRSRAPIASR